MVSKSTYPGHCEDAGCRAAIPLLCCRAARPFPSHKRRDGHRNGCCRPSRLSHGQGTALDFLQQASSGESLGGPWVPVLKWIGTCLPGQPSSKGPETEGTGRERLEGKGLGISPLLCVLFSLSTYTVCVCVCDREGMLVGDCTQHLAHSEQHLQLCPPFLR